MLAVKAGYPVTAISVLNEKHNNYQLDAGEHGLAWAWCSVKNTSPGQWIQVSSITPKLWNSVIVQGRGDHHHQMTGFKIQYTLDGETWQEYENGKEFSGGPDRNTKIRHNLKPFYAVTVRLLITKFHGNTCMRFDATFINTE